MAAVVPAAAAGRGNLYMLTGWQAGLVLYICTRAGLVALVLVLSRRGMVKQSCPFATCRVASASVDAAQHWSLQERPDFYFLGCVVMGGGSHCCVLYKLHCLVVVC